MFPRHRVLSSVLLSVLISLGGEAEGQRSVLSHTTFASCSGGGGGPGILLGPPGALFASADGLLVCTGARGRAGGLQLLAFSGSGGVAGGTEKLVGGRVGTAVQGADGGVYYTDLESQEVKRWMGGGVQVVAGHKVSTPLPVSLPPQGSTSSFPNPFNWSVISAGAPKLPPRGGKGRASVLPPPERSCGGLEHGAVRERHR